MNSVNGKAIGRYHILEGLGKGGISTVYKAYDTRLERDVTIKLLRTECLDSQIMILGSMREIGFVDALGASP